MFLKNVGAAGSGRRGVVNAFIALYGLYCSNYVLALIMVPFLVRMLGPAKWGTLAFTQAFCQYLLLVVELGFPYSATRAASQLRNAREQLSDLMASVVSAKVFLGMLCIAAGAIARWLVPQFREDSRLLWWGVTWAVLQGLNLYWFYQGIEKARTAVSIDLCMKAAGVAAIFWLVRTPGDGWKVLALQAASSALSVSVLLSLAYRNLLFRRPRVRMVRDVLRSACTNFVPRNAAALYTMGNAFILGLFASPEIVGAYAGADRIGRAIVGLLGPASDALYPRITHMATRSRQSVRHWARVAMVAIGGAGLLMGAAIFVLAPYLVHIALGPGFDSAVTVLRIFAILPPVVAVRNVLGVHWMMALDLDRIFNRIVLATGLLNIPLAVAVAPAFSAQGVAWVGVSGQCLSTLGTYAALRWMRMDPLAGEIREKEPAACAVAHE